MINIFIAFTGGIITFISPCVLPMIPMYIAYISGLSVKDLEKTEKPVVRILIHSVFFVLGFTLIFSLLAALFYIFFQTLGQYKIWINRIAGIIIIVMGLHLMKVFQIPFLNYEARVQGKMKGGSFLSSFLMGAAFGGGWTPCIGPILSGILFTVSDTHSPLAAVGMLIIYSMGMGIPFILTGLMTERILKVFQFIKKNYEAVEKISGAFLITLGLLLLFGGMGYLSNWFTQAFPGLAGLEMELMH